jgi:hypothetical protein
LGLNGYLIWDVLKDRPFYLYLTDLAKKIIGNLNRIRDPLWGEFEPRAPIKQASTAGPEMTLPFLFWKSSLGLLSIRTRRLLWLFEGEPQ